MSNLESLFPFLFSPSTPLRAVSLSNGRFITRNENINQFFCFFIFSHSTFDVERSMFNVHFFSKTSRKDTNTLS